MNKIISLSSSKYERKNIECLTFIILIYIIIFFRGEIVRFLFQIKIKFQREDFDIIYVSIDRRVND